MPLIRFYFIVNFSFINQLEFLIARIKDVYLLQQSEFIPKIQKLNQLNQHFQTTNYNIYQSQLNSQSKPKMRSKKDQGNSLFKQQKYAQAIQCYQQYVKLDHPDNSKAYGNMALSCFKLKKYQDCIDVCQKAVQLEPEFQKGYFRMYQAYKQLKNYYGMIISANKFCKISKDQKEIQTLQKAALQAKQKLSQKDSKAKNVTENDKIILQIINQGQQVKQTSTSIKQPQCSLDTKWQRIIQKIKIDKYEGFNAGRKFIMKQCITQQQKEKYKKLLSKIKYSGLKQDSISKQNQIEKTNQSSQSDEEEEVKVEDLQKYNKKKEKLQKQSLSIKQKIEVKQSIQNKVNLTSFKKVKQLDPKKVEKNQSNQTTVSKEPSLKLQSSSKQTNNPSVQVFKNSKQQNTQNLASKIQNASTDTKSNDQSWQNYVSQQEAHRLFQTHIQDKLAKIDDKFTGFFDCAICVLRSTQLDRYQKMAILTLAPTQVKKFSLLSKSYTGRQRQQLSQIFTQNNLHSIYEAHYLKK